MSPSASIHDVLRASVVAAITGYQRWISPHKGYRCARRVVHGGKSCSEYGKRIAARCDVAHWWPLMNRRFRACAMAAAQRRQKPLRVPPMNEGRSDRACDAVWCCAEAPTGVCCLMDAFG